MKKSSAFKAQLKKVLKAEGHSHCAQIMLRLKASKERDYLIDSSRI